jgi:hypothetical protein
MPRVEFNEALIQDEADEDPYCEGPATEAKGENLVVSTSATFFQIVLAALVVTTKERIQAEHVAFQSISKRASQNGNRLK